MPLPRRFIQCDVFTATPTLGNALAVVIDGDGLDDQTMQRFAAWTNLAETTFLMPPTDPAADYQVRIFTPAREMRFAGHPTLGSCASWLHTGGMPRDSDVVRQQCAIGIVDIDIASTPPAFIAPPTQITALPDAERQLLADKLQLRPDSIIRTARLDNGPVWQAFWLDSAESVLAVDANRVSWPDEQAIGLLGPWPAGSPHDHEVRMLAPSSGMLEDPITGSLNAALAHWMLVEGALPGDCVVGQGQCIGREGRVYIRPDSAQAGQVRIGGQTHILIEGTVVI